LLDCICIFIFFIQLSWSLSNNKCHVELVKQKVFSNYKTLNKGNMGILRKILSNLTTQIIRDNEEG